MKNQDETPRSEAVAKSSDRRPEDQSETSYSESLLSTDPWKPCRRSRATVKALLLKLRLWLGSVCGMEWYAYAALGILAAVLSFLMDICVSKLLRAHQWLYMTLEGNSLLQFFCWTLYPACLCAVAASFCHNICPFSTGSGIPEARTMMGGIKMTHYLSLSNMFTKFLGLICALAAGSTVFLGKVGPFVHLTTMVGAYLSKACTLIQTNKQETAAGEMLAVAAAVGVASCFGAPISGVLFSVEVTCSHFALSHYCPCFFAAACGALTFRLLSVWSGDGETVQALFKTHFPSAAIPFYPLEMLLFAFLGLLCGVVSCCYLSCHRWMLQFTKTNPVFIKMLTTEKSLYSGMVAFFLASLTFPHSAGQYMASKHTMKQLLTSLLQSGQWSSLSHNASVGPLELEWSSSGTPALLSLAFFLLMKMWMMVLACSLPLPAGYFMPVFVYGAALGRLLGEGVAYVSPSRAGISSHLWSSINPGGYALAGAAALSGAVTHTLSPALLALELTGQFSHAVPILLATLLANSLARYKDRPSFYDALSISKRLPHLPSLTKACPRVSSTPLGQVLSASLVQLQRRAGPEEVHHAVNSCTAEQIPVVDSHESLILLGFVLRSELLLFLHHHRAETVDKCLDEVCSIYPTSVLLSPHNTVQEAHNTLSLLGARTLFVADRGRLVGILAWPQMKGILEDLAKEI